MLVLILQLNPIYQMRSSQKRYFAAQGGAGDYMSHATPGASVSLLARALLSVPKVELTKLPRPLTSATAMRDLMARGARLREIPFSYYNSSTYSGSNRKLDNSDILKGKEVLYDNLEHALRIHADMSVLISKMLDFYRPLEATSLVASMELQDLTKITVQQWKPTGWHLASPVTDAKVPQKLSDEAVSVLRRVAQHYGQLLKTSEAAGKSIQELTMMDSDPQTTMTGAPTYASGARSHEARLATLAALPSPAVSPAEWVRRMKATAIQMGFDPVVFFSPVLSTRTGPLRKPTTLWTLGPSGYEAFYESVGLYNRTRFVFPAPYFVNFVLSPIYVEMSSVRKKKLGLWHDPESQAQYIEQFKRQGKKPYTIDFSGMDTAMWPSIIMTIIRELKSAGFSRWPLEVFEILYPEMGVVLPSYLGRPGSATLLEGPVRPWCSGFKLTSEMDTIYGAAVLLSALQRQRPSIVDEWIQGTWCFAELGDDIAFTASFEIDSAKLAADALELWGAKLEIIHDAMFLKWFLPIHPEIPKLARSFSRFVQQTFYNEDRYTGGEGGDKPPAVMRLGLMARMEGLINHPHFSRWWPQVCASLLELKYVRDASSQYREKIRRGEPAMDVGDDQAILEYSVRVPTYLSDITERAKFEPSAAALLRILEARGLASDQTPGDIAIRSAYWEAFITNPTPRALSVLATIAKQ